MPSIKFSVADLTRRVARVLAPVRAGERVTVMNAGVPDVAIVPLSYVHEADRALALVGAAASADVRDALVLLVRLVGTTDVAALERAVAALTPAAEPADEAQQLALLPHAS